jgi:hypothetical protein
MFFLLFYEHVQIIVLFLYEFQPESFHGSTEN